MSTPAQLEQFRRFAAYNRWMNERLYAHAGELPDEARTRDLGAFFGSLHRTLNHLLLTDRVWLARFRRFLGGFPSLEGAELVDAFDSLGDRRVKVDRDPFVIGRRPEAGVHFVIEQEGVSRRHAMLERGEMGWVIFDLGSTNGLLVNGSFVAGAPIRPGDMISLGPVLLVVEQG